MAHGFMVQIKLRKIELGDKNYFVRWWRDDELLRLTSGVLESISDKEVDEYFKDILNSKNDFHFLIILGGKVLGHVSLSKRGDGWYETQIIIGEREYRGKGYGSESIKLLIKEAKIFGIIKIYLEVRPDNERAIRAYEKCGFLKVGKVEYKKNKFLPETLRMELSDNKKN